MNLQWYRLDPETGRMVWMEGPSRPGPEWEASDVPLFDSARQPAWTAQEKVTSIQGPSAATGLFQVLPEGRTPGFDPPARRMELRAMLQTEDETVLAEQERWKYEWGTRQWHRKRYPQAGQLDAGTVNPHPLKDDPLYRHEVIPMSMMGAPRPDRRRQATRAWWRQVHRRSSTSRVPTPLPRRSGLRLAGFRPLTSGRRR